MKTAVIILVIIISSLVFFSCKDNPVPPGQQPQATLILEDISCTEAWIKLITANISLPAEVDLYREDILAKTIGLSKSDTLLYVDSLLPGKTYNFHTVIHSYNHTAHVTSNQLPAATLDATSHNFTWQTWTFGGQAGSCELYDVAIIDENDIWGVGKINIADTSINGYTTYNAVHWDGLEWKLLKIQFYTFCGQPHTGSYPTKSIFAFGKNDIWITSGSQITHFDGERQLSTECIPVSVNKLWGTSNNDLYAAGVNGKIAHYQNEEWTRIESGTDANITDIWGVTSSQTNERKIYCSVPSGYEPSKRRILTINEYSSVDSIPRNGNIVTSVWATQGGIIYTSGWQIYSNKSGAFRREISVPDYYSHRIRGNDLNDIFVCGNYGFLAHFNGMWWKVYRDLTQLNLTLLTSIGIKNGIATAVGFIGEAALVILGKRN